ncbi:MAG TPA: GGDEF domain-containing protein [Planctomycetota bacterium]|nr:GGDEF domain-containing protein [Planctomycetota bacterium]
MDNTSARQKVEVILGGRISDEEMRLLGGCLDDLEKRAADHQKRLRRQEQEFTTIFEMVGQISARAMNSESLIKYLLRTVMGQFMVPRLAVLRRTEIEARMLALAAAQGFSAPELSVEVEGPLGQFALGAARPFDLSSGDVAAFEDAARLRSLGLVTCVPLVQQADGDRPAQLEGLLLLGERLAGGPMGPVEKRMLGLLGQAVAITFHNEMLYRRSIIDDLTGVASRGHFDAHLNQEINRIKRYGGRGICLVMVDLDHFKKVNDTHGHQAGDAALRKAAAVLRDTVRTVDMVARYGGEEFAVILLEIERDKAQEVAERLRSRIEAARVECGGVELGITASFGVACFPDDGEDKQKLIGAADSALYRAKASGRNRVVMAPSGAADGGSSAGEKRG